MEYEGVSPARRRGGRTRDRIKKAALDLFAEHGIDTVSVRDILRHAGQKNAGSINYYFNSRADLVDELIHDVAALLDQHFERALELREQAGGPLSVRDLATILVDAPHAAVAAPMRHDDERDAEEIRRFLAMALREHRPQLFDRIGRRQGGAALCLQRMRELAPPMHPEIARRREALVMTVLMSAGAHAVDPQEGLAREVLADALAGVMTAPVTPAVTAAAERAADGLSGAGEPETAWLAR